MEINRNHKDRLFRFIFGDPEHKERTLELYNALNGSDYEDLELMEASRFLREYAELIRRLKEACTGLKDKGEILAATTLVVDQCIQEGILRDILIQNRDEVIDMFLTEYNLGSALIARPVFVSDTERKTKDERRCYLSLWNTVPARCKECAYRSSLYTLCASLCKESSRTVGMLCAPNHFYFRPIRLCARLTA